MQINYGIKTGFNEAFIITTEIRNELIAKCPKADSIIRPVLFGENIKRYYPDWKNYWLIDIHNGIKSIGLKRIELEKDYPAILERFLPFKSKLEKRNDKGDKWYNLRNCTYLNDFQRPKIIYPEITKFINFYYDVSGHYLTNNKCFIITGSSLEFLTCFFNSSLFKYCFLNNFPELLGGTRELRKIFFEKIPVIKITEQKNQVFKQKITEIQTLKKNSQSTLHLEKEVDTLIFDLYNLNQEDRKAIGFIEIL